MAVIDQDAAKAACTKGEQAAADLWNNIVMLGNSDFAEERNLTYWQAIQAGVTALDTQLQEIEQLVFPGTQSEQTPET